jgi:hypothetical protein
MEKSMAASSKQTGETDLVRRRKAVRLDHLKKTIVQRVVEMLEVNVVLFSVQELDDGLDECLAFWLRGDASCAACE